MASLRRGHPEVFTVQQNKALRIALREYQSREGLTQAKLGEALDVSQQTAGTLLKDTTAGFSYQVASRLCRLVGYATVDSFFRAKAA